MGALTQDLRYALRQMRKNPGFFLLTALTLAIAIGANGAIFTVVNAFLMKKPRVPDPDRLLVVSSVNLADRGGDRSAVSPLDYVDWRSQATSFDGMAAARFDDFTISSDRNPQRITGARVSPEFVSQLALSLVLFVGAGLFVEGFVEETRAKTGFNENNLLTASVSLRGPTYAGSTQRQTAFFSSLLEKLRSNSQTQSAALADALPFNFPSQVEFTVEASTGKPQQKASSGYVTVSPEYFSTLQVPLFEGREFSSLDGTQAPPNVVVNRAFAKRYFGNTDPIGLHIRIDGDNSGNQWSEVVGIVGDVPEFLGQQTARPHIYAPLLVHPKSEMKIVVRTRTSAEIYAGALRGAVAAIDSDQAVTNVRTMQRVINDSGGGDDLMSGLMSTFALIALVMAAIGTYGVLSYVVGQRTKEMGIRMAVGANPGQVRRMIVRSGATLAALGVLLGVSVSLALPKLMASVFSGFGFHSALVVTAAPVMVLMIALVACYIPARRAAKVDPNVALRYE